MASIREIEGRLTRWHRQSRVSRLLATVPGVGIIGASAIAATVTGPSLFRSGREFVGWLGITPRQNSSGGKERLGRTSKRGDKYIRSVLTAGAVAVLQHACNRATRDGEWVRTLLARKSTKVAAVALAIKTARIVWALMVRGAGYQPMETFGQPHRHPRPIQNARVKRRLWQAVEPRIGRTGKSQGAEQRVVLIGTGSANSIRASGHMHRTEGRTYDCT